MEDSNKHILLAKWLEGNLTDEEVKDLKKEIDLDSLESAIKRVDNYDFPAFDENVLFESIKDKVPAKTAKVRNIIPLWVKAVAAVFIIVLASMWWYIDTGTTVIASNGEVKTVILPNQSEVLLNAGSKLTYYTKNWKKYRRMKLDGEAFFKVSKGKPFKIETPNGTVEVLGTQFEVFDRDNLFEVICYKGKVRVETKSGNLEEILTKGKGVKVHNNRIVKIEEKNTKPQWIDGISTFAKATLKEVFDEFERQFDVEIETDDVDLKRRFSGQFQHNDINIAIREICASMNLNYQIIPGGKKIIITKSK